MGLTKNTRHPNFIIGLLSFLLFLLGIVLKANSYSLGNILLVSAIGLGAIHWIWSIIDVSTGYDLQANSKIFWLILVVLIPPVGGMLFYSMKRKNVSM